MARQPPDDLPPTGGTGPAVSARAPAAVVPRLAPRWLDPSFPPLNDDLDARVVLDARDALWRPSPVAGIEVRVLELIGGRRPRASAQLRLAPGREAASLGATTDVEMLVQAGELEAGPNVWPAGLYVRLPANGEERFDELVLRAVGDAPPDVGSAAPSGALLYVATGHIAPSDTEQRRIDMHDARRWLPGPVQGTEVLPLHGHGSGNVMLIRWLGAVAFRPNLDPLGEEVLVLEGRLHDAEGEYTAGTWIRNPIPAWQSWSADPGTVAYYKNGHFATRPEVGSPPVRARADARGRDRG